MQTWDEEITPLSPHRYNRNRIGPSQENTGILKTKKIKLIIYETYPNNKLN